MLSLKRLAYVLLIVFGICGIFIIYSLNENREREASISNPVVEEKELIQRESLPESQEPVFYVVGSEEKETCKNIYKNVCQLMEDMKVSWSKKERIGKEELENHKAVLIFCDDVASSYIDLPLLVRFMEEGGKVIMAAGVPEGYEDSYLMPVLGITEKTNKESYEKFHFTRPFLVMQEEDMTYGGYNVSTCLTVRKDAVVYMEEAEKQVPVLYTYPYGKGEALVVNGTFLNDAGCMGFLTAGIGCLLGEFIYPVLGTERIYLDHFPVVTYVNDPACMKLYGRTTESFVRDVVWPVFQGMALRNEIKYTSSVLCVSSRKGAFPAISQSLFHTMGKSALQYNGEMAYASDCRRTAPVYRNDAFIDDFEQTFENYHISSLVMISGQPAYQSIDTLGKKIQMVRGKLDADNPKERMTMLEDYGVFPEATEGTSLEEGNMLEIASVLTSHGMVSHTFDLNQLLDMEGENAHWDEDREKIMNFEKKILRKTSYLEKLTLSGTKNALKSYESLEYTWKRKGNKRFLYATQFVKGQPFLVRTTDQITKAKGAEYEKIADDYYLLHLNSSKAVITIEKGGGE